MSKTTDFNPRKFMEMAIEEMENSVHEPRADKTSPFVGAIILKPDNSIEKAHRGELRDGDHAEFTLLERKNRSEKLDGSLMFVTLEPCAPGARSATKLSCAERIVNARIEKVWIGIEDPDPTVDRKGISYLLKKNINVEMFDMDLQEKIREINSQFIIEAYERAEESKKEKKYNFLNNIEKVEKDTNFEDLSIEEIQTFIEKAKLNAKIDSKKFINTFKQLGFISNQDKSLMPTGLGILLFGNNPQLKYQNAVIRATFQTGNRGEDITTFEGSIVRQRKEVQDWYKSRIDKQIDRTEAERQIIYDYPFEVFREVITNAIVHRDYDIKGAPILLEINDNAIVIKSPGETVPPLTLEQIQKFRAPSLSRNPKIMYVFDKLKLVEQRGIGFKTIRKLPEDFDIPLPIITYESPYIVVTLPRNINAAKVLSPINSLEKLNDEELRGYEYIRTLNEFTRKDYEEHFKFEKKKAERHLKRFVELKLIKRMGSARATYYVNITT